MIRNKKAVSLRGMMVLTMVLLHTTVLSAVYFGNRKWRYDAEKTRDYSQLSSDGVVSFFLRIHLVGDQATFFESDLDGKTCN